MLTARGRYDTSFVENGELKITFSFPFNHRRMINKLKKDKKYHIEIKEEKNDRTIQQNKYMWALLHDIAEEMNGDYDTEELYCMAIETCGIQVDLIAGDEQIQKTLEKNYRVVRPLEYIPTKNGTKWRYYKLYRGSSHFNTKEMTMLIDRILDLAVQVGIETSYWKELLK